MVGGQPVGPPTRLAPSSLNCTPAMPTLSAALADTVIVPETVAPEIGAVTETVGGVMSLLATVTWTPAVAVLPAASRATAVRAGEPRGGEVGWSRGAPCH